ncbi:MAG: DUF917 domain-containing protein [Candidatus Leucobacter sulfamidivorax]|nr:DUF917 domain-containing protein [Candidatus Leucobacter sulfamidivorax]
MWRLERDHLEALAIGAGVLGTGGGGNPYIGTLAARRLLESGRTVEIIDPAEVPDDWTLCTVGGVGAPTIGVEKIVRGTETTDAVRTLEEQIGRRIDAVVPAEIGGGNSIEPMIVAANLGIPVVDGDGMGRAFPTLPRLTFLIYGVSCYPAAVADEKGNRIVFPSGVDFHWLERLSRNSVVQMGGFAGMAVAVMDGATLKRYVVPRTLSLAIDLGRRVLSARAEHRVSPVDAIIESTGALRLFEGKVVDVERRTEGGWNLGSVRIEGSGVDAGSSLEVSFQNENLIAWRDGEVVATVPDLVCIVNQEDATPITTEMLRYGYRVSVLGLRASELLVTPEALEIVGPESFGYPDIAYAPLQGAAAVGDLVKELA